MNWPAVFMLLTVVLFYTKTVKPIGRLSKHVDLQIAKCMDNSHYQTIASTLQRQVMCIKEKLGWCLRFHEKRINEKFVSRPICGVLNSGTPPIYKRWTIVVWDQFALRMQFLTFHIPSSRYCLISYVKLFVEDLKWLNQNVGDLPTLIYCGKRAPWNVTSRLSYALLETFSFTNAIAAKGFNFIMYYEAIDVMDSNIKIVRQFTESKAYGETFTTHIVQFWNIRLSLIDTGLEALQTVTFRNYFGNHTCLRFNSTNYLLTIYDGPGSHSPTLYKGLEIPYFCFTSFLGYVEIESKQKTRGEKRAYIAYAYGLYISHSLTIAYESTKLILSTASNAFCKRYVTIDSIILTASSTRGKPVFCNWLIDVDDNVDEIYFRRFNYNGYNMLTYWAKEDLWRSQPDTCQYGGLFVSLNNRHRQWTFPYMCNTIRKNTLVPIPMFFMPWSYHELELYTYVEYYTRIQIMFAMFPGYSDGQLAIEFKRSGCNDNYLWSNECFSNLSRLRKKRYDSVEKAQTCSRLVVTQNVGPLFKMRKYECKSFTANSITLLTTEKRTFQGMVEMRITNNIMIFTPTYEPIAYNGYLLVWVKAPLDFPRVMTIDWRMHKVASSYSITLHLSHIKDLIFTVHNTMRVDHSRYILGHIIQYLICVTASVEYQLDHTNSYATIYIRTGDEPKHQNKNSSFRPEICTTRIVLHRACRTLSYSVRLEMMTWSDKDAYGPVKLIIFKLPSTNCSLSCSVLDVTYIGIRMIQSAYYSAAESVVWRDVHFVEHTMFNRYDGFSLQINSTIHSSCNCKNRCDVVFLFVKMNVEDVPHFVKREESLHALKAGNLKVSSWLDAAAECRRQAYNMMTLTPLTVENLQKYAMSHYFNDAKNYRLGDVMFIGLYKTNEVRDVVIGFELDERNYRNGACLCHSVSLSLWVCM